MEAQLKTLRRERGALKSKLTAFKRAVDAQIEDIDELEGRVQRHESLFEKFDVVQTKMDELMYDEDTDEVPESEVRERAMFEDTYGSVMARAKREIARIRGPQAPAESPQTVSSQGTRRGTRLPHIPVPTFDGRCDHWLRFRDTFVRMVHENDELNDVDKFHYLDAALSGEAARVIKSLGVSEDNYQRAWASLKKRYEDANALTHHHVKALFELTPVLKKNSAALREIRDAADNHVLALGALGEPVHSWDTLLIYLLAEKLDTDTYQKWSERVIQSQDRAKFAELLDFIEKQAKILGRRGSAQQGSRHADRLEPSVQNRGPKKAKPVTAHIATARESCSVCKEGHALIQCPKFRAMTVAERLEAVKASMCCYNCLQPGHGARSCKRWPCRTCQKRHHTLLHRDEKSGEKGVESEESDPPAAPTIVTCLAKAQIPTARHTLLSTAIVNVQDGNGKPHRCRALLDIGSQAHLITEELCAKLGLTRSKTEVSLGGVGANTSLIREKAEVVIRSLHNNYKTRLSCMVMRHITGKMPNVPVDRRDIQIPSGLNLADPHFDRPGKIDLLISAEIFWQLICIGQHRIPRSDLVLQKTHFGWVVGGGFDHPLPPTAKLACHVVTNRDLHRSIARFWEIETPAARDFSRTLNPADKCERFFKETVTRDADGRFRVGIPFNDKVLRIGESRDQAERRLYALERRLKRDEGLRRQYAEFMEEYIALGHMSLLDEPPSRSVEAVYYLPHHAVRKETSTTTKVRVVFDGSARSSSGVSLNDAQVVGPRVQSELLDILLRFRRHRYVISADIEKMYRQVLIRNSDRRYQRVLWRRDASAPIRQYSLNTVTYGTAAASYLATRVLREIGEQGSESHPEASRAIIRDFYVDDLLTGCDSVDKLKEIRRGIVSLLDKARMPLRKWATNEPNILDAHPSEPGVKPIGGPDSDPKTLGLLWHAREDELRYAVKLGTQTRISKRIILSEISQIFDPLGLIGPVIVVAKIIMQEIWRLAVGWDDSLPQETHTRWSEFRAQIGEIESFRIPRCAAGIPPKDIELHGFADASERAYGAVVYLRTHIGRGKWESRLLCSKSRVAPLRVVSLPRLELCGALLLAQLMNAVGQALTIGVHRRRNWTDSTIALAWIRSESSRWKTFVANRVSEIQELSAAESWGHVPTGENPADIISRGSTPADLMNCRLWWNGPSWLSQSDSAWPSTEMPIVNPPEERSVPQASLAVTRQVCEISALINRHSSYRKLKAIVAYCYRFLNALRFRIAKSAEGDTRDSRGARPTRQELARAEELLIHVAQREYLANEMRLLREEGNLPKGSPLIALRAFMDGNLIRVGGRLSNAPVPYAQRHPWVLPPKHPVTKMIVVEEHVRLLHAGQEQTLASVRLRFWPIGGRRLVRGILQRCVKCFRFNPAPARQLMGDLPLARVTQARPFYACGIDYAGPFLIREQGRARVARKAYMCLFVCLATKAVHLELAVDLSSNAFMNCMRRFVARRGRSRYVFSDNGTNFVGARNELKELSLLLTDSAHRERVRDFMEKEQMKWSFIPPHSPHFGGLWERAIRSAKTHLKKVVGDQRLTYEELYTILTQVESCLNSRPLSPLSNDPTDLSPLTPGHFLIGEPLTALPDQDLTEIRSNRLCRFRLLQQVVQQFWKRWHTEYLHGLQQRTKWQTDSRNLSPGELIVLREDNSAPLHWRLGRIKEVHPGADGRIRVVTVKTADGTFKRPVNRVSPFPPAREEGGSSDPDGPTKTDRED